MEVNVDQIQEAWIISINYIVIGVLIVYEIDLLFWWIKQMLKHGKR